MPTRKPWSRAKPVTSVVRVALLELVEARAVDQPRDDLAHVVRLARVGVDDAVDLLRDRRPDLPASATSAGSRLAVLSVPTIVRARCSACVVVFGEVVGDAREPRVDVGAAELFGGDLFAGRRLHERRAAEEDRAGAADDDRFVRHRRHVGAAGRAGPHHDGDLRDPLGRHPRLVEEDAAEVIAIGEDLGLQRQERAARVDEIDAGQPVLQRDFLRADVLLHREGIVGAALDRGVVGDDEHFAARHAADAGDDAGRRAPRCRRGPRRRAARARGTGSPDRAARRCARGPAACPARDGAAGTSRRRPARAAAIRSRSSATSAAIRSRLRRNSSTGRIDVGGEAVHAAAEL